MQWEYYLVMEMYSQTTKDKGEPNTLPSERSLLYKATYYVTWLYDISE